MPISIYLHVKCPFKKKKWNKKKMPVLFFLWNFHAVFGEQIAIIYQIFKSGSSKKKLNVLNLQRCPAYSPLHLTDSLFPPLGKKKTKQNKTKKNKNKTKQKKKTTTTTKQTNKQKKNP